MNWIKPTKPKLPPPRVFDANGREITLGERQAVPNGGRVLTGVLLMDHDHQPKSQTKELEMTFSPHLTTIDGVTTTKDSAIKQLQDQLTAERSRADRLEGELSAVKAFHAPASAQPVHDATATLRDAAEASRLALRDRLLAQQAAKFEQGSRAKQLSDAWR